MRRLLILGLLLLLQFPAAAQEKVRVGVSTTMSTAGIFIAHDRGYFAKQGLSVELVPFAGSGPEMLPALAGGQLDVGAGNLSARMYNAIVRGVALRIVADKGSNTPGSGYLALVARKAVAADIKGPADLKGRRVAVTGPGVSQEVVLDRYLRRGGLTVADVQLVFMSYQDAAAGLASGAIDATVQIEPLLSEGIARGDSVIIERAAKIYPNQQSAVIAFGENFATNRRHVGERFMVAYLQGVRDYHSVFITKTARPALADEVARSIAKWTSMRNTALLRRAAPVGLNLNGLLNVSSMIKDLSWYESRGYVKERPPLDKFIDHSFVQAALTKVGKMP
ncbi:MAG: transporter substrate-binding domain-containing protein [Armatimonadetes bacterium]|nr:transporter substrate-binding domain-containing protein [Armatimonadota bacterium]